MNTHEAIDGVKCRLDELTSQPYTTERAFKAAELAAMLLAISVRAAKEEHPIDTLRNRLAMDKALRNLTIGVSNAGIEFVEAIKTIDTATTH